MTMLALLLQLFVSFFTIGFFSYGGGYAMIPFIEREIVVRQAWLTAEQFIDIIAIAEVTPGPIAVNSATFVGYKIAGVGGSIVATIGVVAPSLLVLMLIAYLFIRYQGAPGLKAAFAAMRPAVVVLIAMAAISLGQKTITDFRSIILAVTVLVLMLNTKINPILLLLASGVIGALIF